jgi:hypothetical protein
VKPKKLVNFARSRQFHPLSNREFIRVADDLAFRQLRKPSKFDGMGFGFADWKQLAAFLAFLGVAGVFRFEKFASFCFFAAINNTLFLFRKRPNPLGLP